MNPFSPMLIRSSSHSHGNDYSIHLKISPRPRFTLLHFVIILSEVLYILIVLRILHYSIYWIYTVPTCEVLYVPWSGACQDASFVKDKVRDCISHHEGNNIWLYSSGSRSSIIHIWKYCSKSCKPIIYSNTKYIYWTT